MSAQRTFRALRLFPALFLVVLSAAFPAVGRTQPASQPAAAPGEAATAPAETAAAPAETAAPAPIATPDHAPAVARRQATPEPATARTRRSLLTGPSRFGLGLGMSREWRSDRGYERFQGQAHTMFRLVGSVDAWRFGRLALAGEASFETGYEAGSDVVLGDASLRTDSVVGAFVPRFALTPWLLVHARLGVGAVLSKLRLSQPFLDARTERDWGYVVDLAAGVGLALPEGRMRTRSGRLGTLMPLLRMEGGYRFAADAHLGARKGASDDGELPVNLSPLGTLQRSAVFVRLVGLVRF